MPMFALMSCRLINQFDNQRSPDSPALQRASQALTQAMHATVQTFLIKMQCSRDVGYFESVPVYKTQYQLILRFELGDTCIQRLLDSVPYGHSPGSENGLIRLV